MYKSLVSTALLTAASLVSFSSHAALLEIDYLNAGDGLLIHDTNNNREWLDVTATTNLSANEAIANHSGAGFRIATTDDVFQLFTESGAVDIRVGAPQSNPRDPGIGGTVANRSAIESLLALMNHSAPYGATSGNPWVHGYTDFGSATRLTLSRFAAFEWDTLGRANVNSNGSNWNWNYRHVAIGTYLVRDRRGNGVDVPEPGTIALLCLGVLGLIGVRRRQYVPVEEV